MDATTTAPISPPMGVHVDPEREFADLYAALWPRLYRTAAAIAGDARAGEDAVQSAFAKAYASWSRVRRADNVEAYVRRMVVNEVLGARRSGFFRRERPHEDAGTGQASVGHADAVADRDAIWAAVRALPPRQRAVIVLRYYEDLDEAQIAATLGCSRGTVKSQASAALANLRRAGATIEGEDR